MADSKKLRFSKSRILNIFSRNFLQIGPWISKIDWCKGHWRGSTYVDVRLSDISSKTAKKHKNAFLACFRVYIGQSHSHVGWATSMPFASINPTNPRTNLWNFGEKFLRIGDFEIFSFFRVGHFAFFFQKRFFFCFIPIKISPNSYGRMDRSKFWCFPGFQKFLAMRNITLYSVL